VFIKQTSETSLQLQQLDDDDDVDYGGGGGRTSADDVAAATSGDCELREPASITAQTDEAADAISHAALDQNGLHETGAEEPQDGGLRVEPNNDESTSHAEVSTRSRCVLVTGCLSCPFCFSTCFV